MNIIGGMIFLISTLSIIIVIVINCFKFKFLRNYWFYFAISIVYLIYFILFRYINNIKDFITFNHSTTSILFKAYYHSFYWSKLLLLDLCPFISIFLPLSLIIDKSRNIAKVLALFGILGGIVTIYGNLILVKEIDINFFKYIFLGEKGNYLFFSSHWLIILISLFTLINAKKFTKWSIMGFMLFIISYIIYVLIISYSLNIQCNTTGLQKGDWYNPYDNSVYWYSQYSNLFKITPFDYRLCIVIWYTIATIIIIIIICLKNWLSKSKDLLSNKLWWNKLKKIDDTLNHWSITIEKLFKNNKIN